ncbi:DUF3737 family protein [Treponema sp.]|uniref:DUF3737 family protein n=1 Tax=Treponema sp. TaxID=166 RepID=UPI0025DB675C|nr:DUF3737 family protein [Treponema sp.]MCR5217883.1 DUF3737 family protein [Treponema sp.]
MIYENNTYDEERALYGLKDVQVKNCRFDGPADGESALKETKNIEVSDCFMNLRYPFWHVTNGKIYGCQLTENCRAALWYDKNIHIENCQLNGIKALRECEDITLKNSSVNSPEFIWKVKGLNIENVKILGSEYPFFEVKDAKIKNLEMKGKYSFQYDENIEISDSNFDTKDAFWHSKNMVIRDSVIKGEYLAWYSENLKFINCRIIGTQPFCYCKNLVLENCTMENCDLAFENSTVNATVNGKIDSVKNPLSGKITADEIGEIIRDEHLKAGADCIIEISK